MSEIKVNLVSPRSGTTVTLGEAGDTIALGACASQTGFGSECMSWCSTIKSTAFCAAAGKGYFVNTCGGGVTVTLPATATQGDTIEFKDYKRTWGTACKALTINSNSLNYQGSASAALTYDTDGQAVKIVYADASQGWKPTVDDDASYVHQYNVQYMVVGGGGGGGPGEQAGGGGAGGMRNVATKSFSVIPGCDYTVTVGGGGAAPDYPGASVGGVASVFSTITSAGGGYGGQGNCSPTKNGDPGGSGGGGGSDCGTAGTGNDPPVSPDQGTPGGAAYSPGPGGSNPAGGGAGGGHACAGQAGQSTGGGTGGDGTVCGIRGVPFDPVAYAGGGGGAAFHGTPGAGGAGGGGAGGRGGPFIQAADAGCNTGGGGGASGVSLSTSPAPGTAGGTGGSGIVIIRRLTTSSTSTSGTVTTCGSDTIHTFLNPGTFTA